MAIKHIKEKSLSAIREKEEMENINAQADVFEVVAMIYEEVEGLKARIVVLEGGGK